MTAADLSVTLTDPELAALVRRVFRPTPADRTLALLVDLPDEEAPDRPAWRWRRDLAAAWLSALGRVHADTGVEPCLYLYRNVHRNNADLPARAVRHREGAALPGDAAALEGAPEEAFEAILRRHDILIALTEFSATAPLKIAARDLGFRAATMPGFSAAMLPALRLDYDEIHARVMTLKGHLDRAARARLEFRVEGGAAHRLDLDLRHRTAHASSGLLPERGTVGNLPSGEAYVVPYEGERPGDPSRSGGELPVELDGEVVVYRVERNVAVAVAPGGPIAAREAALLRAEPAYGNLAELGLGVLGAFGVQPTGEVLLDEKLGLHIAFGRSDHFGGQTGASRFTRPEAVVHIDRVYVPAMQPRVRVALADLDLEGGETVPLIRDDAWVVRFDA